MASSRLLLRQGVDEGLLKSIKHGRIKCGEGRSWNWSNTLELRSDFH